MYPIHCNICGIILEIVKAVEILAISSTIWHVSHWGAGSMQLVPEANIAIHAASYFANLVTYKWFTKLIKPHNPSLRHWYVRTLADGETWMLSDLPKATQRLSGRIVSRAWLPVPRSNSIPQGTFPLKPGCWERQLVLHRVCSVLLPHRGCRGAQQRRDCSSAWLAHNAACTLNASSAPLVVLL